MNHNWLHTKQHLALEIPYSQEEYYPYANHIQGFMWNQLALIGAKMLTGPEAAHVVSCKLTINGDVWSYSGREVNHEMHELIRALQEEIRVHEGETYTLSMTVEYYGEIAEWELTDMLKDTEFSRGINLTTVNLGPASTLKYLDSLEQEQLKGIFYSCWQTDDYPDYDKPDCGTLHAYGEKNGEYYHGEVPYRSISVKETEGVWESDPEAYDLFITDDEEWINVPEVQRLADIMVNWALENTTWNTKLTSASDFEAYLKDAGNLMQLCPYPFMGGYVDKSGDDVRLLHVYLHKDGSYALELAET